MIATPCASTVYGYNSASVHHLRIQRQKILLQRFQSTASALESTRIRTKVAHKAFWDVRPLGKISACRTDYDRLDKKSNETRNNELEMFGVLRNRSVCKVHFRKVGACDIQVLGRLCCSARILEAQTEDSKKESLPFQAIEDVTESADGYGYIIYYISLYDTLLYDI